MVTPETAQELKEHLSMEHNRRVKSRTLGKYIADMISGNWHNNYDPIRVSEEGYLLDGQHRLNAVIESNTTQEMFFIFGIPDEVADGVAMFEVIDQMTRKPFEVFEIQNPDIKKPKEVVALISQLDAFIIQKLAEKPNGVTVTNKTILEDAERHQPLSVLDDFADRGYRLASRGDRILRAKDFSLLVATIGRCHKGNIFNENIADYTLNMGIVYDTLGHEVPLTDPIANVVVTLHSMKYSNTKGANSTKDKWLQIFKAYELFALEKEVSEGYRYTGNRLPYPVDYPSFDRGL